jgi:hypothetical protein
MSTSIQALKRLEHDDQLGIASVARESVRYSERPPRDADELPAAPPAASAAPTHASRGAAAIAGLLDRLRTVGGQADAARVLVFAAVGPDGSTRAVIDGLAGRGRELTIRVGVGELTRIAGQAVLAERGGAARRALELDGGPLTAAVASWLEPLGDPQLVLIEAPPVATSADALLLATACDGLVLVAQTGVTARAALRTAIERATAAGCRTLGVVLTTT